MTIVLLVPPAAEPVSLADAKAWLRVDTDAEDALVTSLVVTARGAVEAFTGRVLVSQTWRLTFDAWPDVACRPCFGVARAATAVSIPLTPVAGITAVRVFDAAGVPQILPPTAYTLRGEPYRHWLEVAAPPQPGRSHGGIEIDVVCGYGAPTDVPQPLRQAVLMLVARLFENRGDDADIQHLMRGAAHGLLAPYRRSRLA